MQTKQPNARVFHSNARSRVSARLLIAAIVSLSCLFGAAVPVSAQPEAAQPVSVTSQDTAAAAPLYGQLPHYHIGVPDQNNPGKSWDGQGLGSHRPWQGGW